MRLSRERLRPDGKRLTQAGLARAVGVERNTVSRWENGGMLPKDPAVIASLARVLEVTADWLISGAPPGAPGALGQPARELHEGAAGQYLDPAIAELPGRASAVATGYLDRLRGAGCSAARLRGAASLLLAGARNRVATKPVEKRDDDQVCADIDAAWDLVVRILRREGIRL